MVVMFIKDWIQQVSSESVCDIPSGIYCWSKNKNKNIGPDGPELICYFSKKISIRSVDILCVCLFEYLCVCSSLWMSVSVLCACAEVLKDFPIKWMQ